MCSECTAFKNFGKRSCCAPGGAWFNQCGNHGDPHVSHTWVEGMQACNEFLSESPGEASAHGMLLHEMVIIQTLNTSQQRNASRTPTFSQQQISTLVTGNESDADTAPRNGSRPSTSTSVTANESDPDTADSKTHINLTKVTLFCMFIFLYFT